MYLSSEELPSNGVFEGYDICIAGAGAAGLAMAKRLIGSGKRVIVLAAGLDHERGLPPGFRQKIYDGTLGDFLTSVDPLFLRRSRLHMYGGTTNHFGFWSRPLDDVDFAPRPGYRTASWPIALADLVSFYRDAMAFGDFGPFNFDDLPFWEGVLGGSGFPNDTRNLFTGAVFHAQYDENLHDFQLQLGDALRTAENVTILFNANVLRIDTTPGRGRATSLHCARIDNRRAGAAFRIEAENYVLALGGIETVRLLQLSGRLGNNARDQLGRGFMVHPLITTAAEVRFGRPVAEEVRSFFRDRQVRLRPSGLQDGLYVSDTAPLVDPRLLSTYHVFNAWGVLAPTPATLAREAIGQFRLILRFDPEGDRAEVNINWEQLPNEDSRITLDDRVRDPVFEQPAVRVDWRLLDDDKRTAVRALDLCEAYLRENGAAEFRLTTELQGAADRWLFGSVKGALETGDHHMGALRMSAASSDGIVDPNSRLHAVENLYVAGCAQFPTSGYANPTLTIVALALRLADHLAAR